VLGIGVTAIWEKTPPDATGPAPAG
jgi:hypothetical protein